MALHNKYDKNTLLKQLENEDFHRLTVSFYRYVHLPEVDVLRDQLFQALSNFNVLGRIYIASEGINAQVSLPEPQWEQFATYWESQKAFESMTYRFARQHDDKSFLKLKIKVRPKIVADGLDDSTFDVTDTGRHLSAEEFNALMDSEDSVVVDMRNHYESEVGHFKGAICPDVDTFREELPVVEDILEEHKDKTVLLYCTGGIRCEKASAYLKHKGFEDVNQLRGGIIDYARQVEEKGLENKFIGKNFVFDDRLGERITDDVISSCHQCGNPADSHTNCANRDCHQLFIQCEECAKTYNGCCSSDCKDWLELPEAEKLERRKAFPAPVSEGKYRKGRLTNVRS